MTFVIKSYIEWIENEMHAMNKPMKLFEYWFVVDRKL